MEQRFNQQIAIITGGADGLGKSIGKRLSREGAHVVMFDIDEELCQKTQTEFEKDSLSASYHCVDVSNEGSIKQAIDACMQAHGKIDVMINSAGIVGPTATKITATETADYDKVIAVNLRGSFLMSKYTLAAMEQHNYGRILLIASIAGKEGNPGMCPYSTSKAGVIGLTKSIGKEYAETGITINALAPAVVKTAMMAATDPVQVKYMTDKIPMKRLGDLDEVAAIASWIVSPEASFNTGFTFDLTGGRATY
ncbi:Oxidoreductase, short-chain dehydrogenase/reductase family [Olavius sp. associated proteobacterium Delta 1]|nr:Oxidoreductase, short-chain dehydrogenase/reductase family [Olavius sp. associated proteobacterium Delta 1]